jgi:hypothetical protein
MGHASPVEAAVVQRLSLPLPPRPDLGQLSQAGPAAMPMAVPDGLGALPSASAMDLPAGLPSGLPGGGIPDVSDLGQQALSAATGAAGAAVGAALPSAQLEELAKGLYDKIRDRLKAELRLDRERWGRVTDLAR